jgi:hypothetical protein
MQALWLASVVLLSASAAVVPASAESASGTSVVPAAAESSASCAAVGSSGGFRVTNGAIIGPNGPYVVRGVNIYAYSMAATNNGAAIKATFKGLNFSVILHGL